MNSQFVYVIKRKLHVGLKIWNFIIFLCNKQYFTLSLHLFVNYIFYHQLENKIHIFVLLCNNLFTIPFAHIACLFSWELIILLFHSLHTLYLISLVRFAVTVVSLKAVKLASIMTPWYQRWTFCSESFHFFHPSLCSLFHLHLHDNVGKKLS